jgi:four helix bundle protein
MAATPFDQLDVYRTAITYVKLTRPLVLRLKKDDPTMADQLHRAVLSIPCNTAEGAGEFSTGDKARLYRYALRSTAETVALLDAAHELRNSDAAEHRRMRKCAMRLFAMLTKLVLATVARDGDRDRKRKRLRAPDAVTP